MKKIQVVVWVEDGIGGIDFEQSDDVVLEQENRDIIGDIIDQSGVFDMLHSVCYDE